MALISAGCAHAPRAEVRAADDGNDAYARGLLARRCQGCHAMPDPRSHSREAWARGLAKMRRRLNLPDEDWRSLLALVPQDSAASGVK
ncbi:MAG TPA: hypothetical protein VF363_06140 [Candidatus Eisenbacteria bacterium]